MAFTIKIILDISETVIAISSQSEAGTTTVSHKLMNNAVLSLCMPESLPKNDFRLEQRKLWDQCISFPRPVEHCRVLPTLII